MLWKAHSCACALCHGAVLGSVHQQVRHSKPQAILSFLKNCEGDRTVSKSVNLSPSKSLPLYEASVVSDDGDIDGGDLDSDGENLDFEALISQLFELLLTLVSPSPAKLSSAAPLPSSGGSRLHPPFRQTMPADLSRSLHCRFRPTPGRQLALQQAHGGQRGAARLLFHCLHADDPRAGSCVVARPQPGES